MLWPSPSVATGLVFVRRLFGGAGVVVLACLFACPAQANDAAARRIIGFSPDGRYFAFEQYGTLDWSESDSGYSEIAILDTQTDQFVGGKPIRIVDDEHASTLTEKQARSRAAALAAPVLAKYAIAARGERIAFDRFTFPDENLRRDDIARLESLSQKTIAAEIYTAARISTIQLDDLLADSAVDCSGSAGEGQPAVPTGKARGFRLSLTRTDSKTPILLHEDKSTPASRDCSTSYSLSEVYVFEPKDKPAVVVALVQRFSQGWEGRDRRFIAVTAQIR